MKELEHAKKILSKARLLSGMSQFQLAQASGVGLSTIQKIEQGRPPFADALTFSRLARALQKIDDPAWQSLIDRPSTRVAAKDTKKRGSVPRPDYQPKAQDET